MLEIGTIRTPFTELEDMPIQPRGGSGIVGEVIVKEQYAAGLADLEGFSHIYLLYRFHRARRVELKVVPFMDRVLRGVFATRSPLRPNHIGLSLVELLLVEGARLKIRNLDILDNTPLLDIKPYIEQFDKIENATSGWMNGGGNDVEHKRSDGRFT
ncbi:MAG: tRNA (N6-threonylcarbamoyladenosine(37)-N6)-methyltransferase TrmO [Desulfocapsaceae bacterium]|jgi:tRNA-Thr(GGU) m(6)t(6)A37 methyltransferase TsaA